MELSREHKDAQEALDDTRVTLHEAENQIEVTNQTREHESKERQDFFPRSN